MMKSRDNFVIYKITNTINNKIYIGSAKYFARRKGEHYHMLRNNKHSNQHLQNSYNKYGDVFKFKIIEYCTPETLIEREQYYIDNLKPNYNILKEAYSSLGFKHSDKTKELLSKKFKGQKRSLGRKLSNETKEKIGKGNSKPILQFSPKMEFIEEWDSATQAAHILGLKSPENIRDCARNKTKKAYSFIWIFKKDFELQRIKKNEEK